MFGAALATFIIKNSWNSDKLHDYMYVGAKIYKNIFLQLIQPIFLLFCVY